MGKSKNARLKPLFEVIEREGLELVECVAGGKHYKVVVGLGDQRRTLTVSNSPSRGTAYKTMAGDVRRALRDMEAQ